MAVESVPGTPVGDAGGLLVPSSLARGLCDRAATGGIIKDPIPYTTITWTGNTNNQTYTT